MKNAKSIVSEMEVTYTPAIKTKDRKKIKCSRDIYNIMKDVFPSLNHKEYFYIICLNRANLAVGFHQISAGGISGTVTDSRLIFQAALLSNASGIILCHNHPSGNLNPSTQDIEITQKIKRAGAILDISIIDHVILTEDSYYSFADECDL